MEPDIPRGRAAGEAWRALSPQARRAALAAAARGVAVPDVGVAWAAAGYGRAMSRRLRVLALLTPIITLLAVVGVVGVGLAVHQPAASLVALLVVFLGYLAGMLAIRQGLRRYRRVYDSGLLSVEATRLGAPMPAPDPSVWAGAADDSGFTVPYGATVPVPGPEPRPSADPQAAGVQVVPLRRGPVLLSVTFFALISACLWSTGAASLRAEPAGGIALLVFAVLMTLLLAFIVFAVAPGVRTAAKARFTPSGWELAGLRVRGPWSAVREIRVSPVRTRGAAAGATAGYRVVALMTDHPDGYLAQYSPMRRPFVRRTMRRYGSPVVIVAAPGRTMPLVDLVRLVQRYTDAPVTWG